MEFTSTVDKLLRKDNEASLRHLRIATYHVTPLNEDCGLIEWVDNAVPLRAIIQENLSAKGIELRVCVREILSRIVFPNSHSTQRSSPC
jgi:phosphatidylinositol kinase/protein kinase (PI-3  family)